MLPQLPQRGRDEQRLERAGHHHLAASVHAHALDRLADAGDALYGAVQRGIRDPEQMARQNLVGADHFLDLREAAVFLRRQRQGSQQYCGKNGQPLYLVDQFLHADLAKPGQDSHQRRIQEAVPGNPVQLVEDLFDIHRFEREELQALVEEVRHLDDLRQRAGGVVRLGGMEALQDAADRPRRKCGWGAGREARSQGAEQAI